MTAKRFQIFGDVIEDMQGIIPIILCNNDKQKQKFYNGLNCLNDENEQLKQLLDYADDLIQSYMSVHNRDEWENVKKNITGDLE